jgi:hypothetical protein
MYNLLMTAGIGDWNNPTWVVSSSRFLEYTVPAIASRFSSISDSAIFELKQLPTLFAYEAFAQQPARVGRITEIQRGQSQLKLTLAIDPTVPPIQPQRLAELYGELDIDHKWEVNRTHWAVKDVNLARVLEGAGIVTSAPLLPQPRPPKVFISYSWDSPEHKQWVAQLGAILRQKGIDVILDQWHVRPGEDLAVFMERSVRDADRVLVICTEKYVERAAARSGGVGYEHVILTGELMQNVGTAKFIPVVRQSVDSAILPAVLNMRLRFDLKDGPNQSSQLEALVMDLHNIRIPIPPLGPNPYL